MLIFVVSIIIFLFLSMASIIPFIILDRKSEIESVLVNSPNQSDADIIMDDNSNLLTNKYTPDQINDIIYRLYQEIQDSNSTDIGRNQDIAILMDLICSNEAIVSAVEACDIVTELPIDDSD